MPISAPFCDVHAKSEALRARGVKDLSNFKNVAKYLRSLMSQGQLPDRALGQVRVGCVQRGSPESVAKIDELIAGLSKLQNLNQAEQHVWKFIYSIEAQS